MLVFKDLRLGAGPFNDTRPLAANTVRLIIGLLLTTESERRTVSRQQWHPELEFRTKKCGTVKGIWSVVEVLQEKFCWFRGTNLRRVFTGLQSASISPQITPRTFLLRSGEMGVVYIARS